MQVDTQPQLDENIVDVCGFHILTDKQKRYARWKDCDVDPNFSFVEAAVIVQLTSRVCSSADCFVLSKLYFSKSEASSFHG